MDFRLKVFVTAARNLNYSRTAQELGITQPSVSTHIKLLEDELKVKLFSRQGKGFCLTYSGELLLERAEKIISLYEEMQQEASLLSNVVAGSFTIGIPRAIYYGIFPELAASWCRLSPGSAIGHKIIDLSKAGSAPKETESKDIDAAIGINWKSDEQNSFFTDTLMAVTPSRIKEDSYYDIADTKLLYYEGDPETSADIAGKMSASGFNPQTLTVAATMKDPVSAIKFLTEYGKGPSGASSPLVCFLWKSQIAELLANGTLKAISLTEMENTPPARRHYGLYPAKGRIAEDETFARIMAFSRGWAQKKLLL